MYLQLLYGTAKWKLSHDDGGRRVTRVCLHDGGNGHVTSSHIIRHACHDVGHHLCEIFTKLLLEVNDCLLITYEFQGTSAFTLEQWNNVSLISTK